MTSVRSQAAAEAARLSRKVLVDGRLGAAASQETFSVYCPADGSVAGEAARCRSADVDLAVAAAERAFAGWREIPARERGKLLFEAAARIEANRESIAALSAFETGNALRTQARPEVDQMVDMLRLFAGVASELKGSTFPWDSNTLCYTRREPIGVVGAIIPWNAPLFLTAVKLGPALIAGNTAVLKTAEQAPFAVLRCAEIIQEVLPKGVVNVLSGFGEECGAPLARHPAVGKVTFTGSCDVGKKIMEYAAEKICPVTLELGGKSPNIIFPDADLDEAVPGVIHGMRFTRQGQACTAGTRVFIHRSIYRRVIDAVIEQIGRLRIGDPLDEEADIGAIISSEQLARVTRFVEMARASQGARILCGGRRWGDGPLANGYFFEPTLIEGLPPESPVCQEEIFGPVAVVFAFDDFDEVVAEANRSRYGLAAAIWTNDVRTALTAANRLDAGFVQVNQYTTPRANVSYGGFKLSGIGKENTLESMLDHFTRSKTIMVNHRARSTAGSVPTR